MKAKMNFYTSNGWAGSNYDSKLSTKEIATKVRAYAKKNFPGFKFSVRSEWSMYTDSLYIEVKEGVCIPFIEDSRSAERGYMSTMNTVKGWEKELTPEMFKVLDAVTTYANSFRYDDSDSMQDYFDTNFYLSIKVSDEYKVVEPKEKKSSVKDEKAEEAKEVEAVTVEGLDIVDYSEKAIAVFGDTKAIKDQLKELGGRFNPSLNYNGEKRAGWIFSKKQTDKLRELLAHSKDEKIEEFPVTTKEMTDQKNSIIKWKEIPGCGYEGIELDYIGEGKEYGCIGRCCNGTYWGAFGGVQGSTSGLTPIRKVFDNESDLLEWMEANGFVYKNKLKEIYIPELSEDPQGNDTQLIIDDFAKYGCMDYPTECEEQEGFKLGEVVYDQCGEIGVILAFYEGGEARLNSNGCCDVGKLKKCPKEIAEREVKHMDIIRPGKALTACTVEAYPLENIHFSETDNFNGVRYYDIEGAGIITSAKVRADIQPGDIFNVYTNEERKYGVTYDGVSLNRSLYNDLPGIIEFNNKIEANTLSKSSFYKPMGENVEFYEKKVTGKRYIAKDNPKRGFYHVVDTLDNCPVDFYKTKEEAEKQAETLNSFTDGNGRLKSAI